MSTNLTAEVKAIRDVANNCKTQAQRAVLDIWSHIEPRFGGVGPAAAALAASVQGLSDFQTRQIAVCDKKETKYADGISTSALKLTTSLFRPIADAFLRQELYAAVQSCSVCHVHGLWLPHSIAARQLAHRLKKPIVSSVHGMLEKWELRNKRYKKLPYSLLFERPSLAQSSCLRALSENEATEYRSFGLRNPIAIVPTGIGRLYPTDPAPLLSRFPELCGKQVVLYLSRVHYKKGILNLIQAWKAAASKHRDAHLLVIGADYAGTMARAKALVCQADLTASVSFTGVVSPSEKLQALSIAKYFCLPSYSEGLSAAVLEALSIGVPVIVTPACNVNGIIHGQSGFLTSNDPQELGDIISQALAINSETWTRMSYAATALARSTYDWTVIGKTMLSVYEWLLGGARPDCVIY